MFILIKEILALLVISKPVLSKKPGGERDNKDGFSEKKDVDRALPDLRLSRENQSDGSVGPARNAASLR